MEPSSYIWELSSSHAFKRPHDLTIAVRLSDNPCHLCTQEVLTLGPPTVTTTECNSKSGHAGPVLWKLEMHLGASQLHVGRVDLAPQQLVEGCKAGQDDRLVYTLDAPAWQNLPSALELTCPSCACYPEVLPLRHPITETAQQQHM